MGATLALRAPAPSVLGPCTEGLKASLFQSLRVWGLVMVFGGYSCSYFCNTWQQYHQCSAHAAAEYW
eukprot:963340-Karenia_brevis.AAC.1